MCCASGRGEFPQLKPNKGGTGQRLYRRRDVEMALRIKSLLYDEGYTIPGARAAFKAELRAGKDPQLGLGGIADTVDTKHVVGLRKELGELHALLSEGGRGAADSAPDPVAAGRARRSPRRRLLWPSPGPKLLQTGKPAAAPKEKPRRRVREQPVRRSSSVGVGNAWFPPKLHRAVASARRMS